MRPLILLSCIIAAIIIITQVSRDDDPWVSSTFWTMMTALATAALVLVAYTQLEASRRAATDQMNHTRDLSRIERTLNICLMYDTDPVLSATVRRLEEVKDDLDKHYNEHLSDMISVLNYFDSIAIGIDRNLYELDIVEDHLRPIIISWCHDLARRRFYEDQLPHDVLTEDYKKLRKLVEIVWNDKFEGDA